MRDAEWDRAKQAPWWLMALAIAIIAVGAYAGAYAAEPWRVVGWIVVVATILTYAGLAAARRRRARQYLRQAHGQST